MTEDQAREWLEANFPGKLDRLARFVNMLLEETGKQNLISLASADEIWTRHIVDSAQLVNLASKSGAAGKWIDIGSGAGLPGLVVAILYNEPVVLIEPRRKRVEFLEQAKQALALNVTIERARAENSSARNAGIITARAVASLPRLLGMGQGLANPQTLWLLPKGISAHSEVVEAWKSWHGVFHVEHSITHHDAKIVVASEVRPR